MKVLHVISTLDPRAGGPVAALLGLCEAQIYHGLQVAVISNGNGDQNGGDEAQNPVAVRLRGRGAEISVLQPHLRPFRARGAALDALERAVLDADILHIHGLWEEVGHQASRLAHRHRKPAIFRPCGMLDPWSLAQSRLKKQLYLALRARRDLNRAAALHFTTQTEADLTAALQLRAPALIEPNGVDLSEFEQLPAPGAFRSQHPQIGARPLLLFLSRIHPKKGLDLLIPALARAELENAVLIIAGPDENGYRAQVAKMVAQNGLDKRVIFTGMLQGADRIAAYADADLFVLPSYQENFGNVVIESLAAGTPVVISDQVNLHDEITKAAVGGVVPTDVAALSHELSRWINDAALRHRAAALARPFVRARYDWNQIGARWAEHYARLVAS